MTATSNISRKFIENNNIKNSAHHVQPVNIYEMDRKAVRRGWSQELAPTGCLPPRFCNDADFDGTDNVPTTSSLSQIASLDSPLTTSSL